MTNKWLIVEKTNTDLPEDVKEKLHKAMNDADSLGFLFLGVVVANDEFVILNKRDFEEWYGELGK